MLVSEGEVKLALSKIEPKVCAYVFGESNFVKALCNESRSLYSKKLKCSLTWSLYSRGRLNLTDDSITNDAELPSNINIQKKHNKR
jgi:hypothetical protein